MVYIATHDDGRDLPIFADEPLICEAHHITPECVDNADQTTLGGSALSPSNRKDLTDKQATLASDALADRNLTEEELEELRNLFRDGIIEPGDDVADDWKEDGE